MTPADDPANDNGHREPLAALYALMIIGFGGLVYAPWIVSWVRGIFSVSR